MCCKWNIELTNKTSAQYPLTVPFICLNYLMRSSTCILLWDTPVSTTTPGHSRTWSLVFYWQPAVCVLELRTWENLKDFCFNLPSFWLRFNHISSYWNVIGDVRSSFTRCKGFHLYLIFFVKNCGIIELIATWDKKNQDYVAKKVTFFIVA
jgi:hypothetical protein